MSDPYQNDIDDHVRGKMDARNGVDLDRSKSWAQDYFYMQGYTLEKRKLNHDPKT